MRIVYKPLSVEIFLVSGDPEGMLTATIPFQWTGHVLVFKRPQLEKALAREEAQKPGFYLLIGEDVQGTKFHICESHEFKEQEYRKTWWSTVIFITSVADSLTNDHIQYLKVQIIKKVIKANKILLLDNHKANSLAINNPSVILSEGTTVYMEDFLNKILVVLSVLNFKIF
ncbi:hypothetical protein G7B40_031540 [Aetokthonos hydrillicola Thurmond2011]|jgi:hypothetical protein|uniref:Uncharacterized protein n=1 Tax=Aetokthonos hydrillicola Thurmond2011 TaxID=2712845 RepID=A0AAP5MBB2_9CYAN|nr:hypothetical protein [Aetokthonos hydrillicola]MBO3462863.1 hypothetical protein [Aetokthonos hydrillicola CCALA 1050]MBW4590970.1 hypothetical protein [Aetokthonos hydrillicola CCALA 1050]MDR9899060.1 hypothetical protein [Aetokthonos hydrillicola Thurmond2011]